MTTDFDLLAEDHDLVVVYVDFQQVRSQTGAMVPAPTFETVTVAGKSFTYLPEGVILRSVNGGNLVGKFIPWHNVQQVSAFKREDTPGYA